jgi:hypothetical protein
MLPIGGIAGALFPGHRWADVPFILESAAPPPGIRTTTTYYPPATRAFAARRVTKSTRLPNVDDEGGQ